MSSKYIFGGLLAAFSGAAALNYYNYHKQYSTPVVPHVDLKRYQGRWYEIETNFSRSKNCDATTATYTPIDDTTVSVYNTCVRNDGSGKTREINGKAYSIDSTNARLKVQFFPFLTANYYVADLDPDYKWALVVTPERNYAWILSRETTLASSIVEKLHSELKTIGIDPSGMRRTKHFDTK
eukprot:TRINITY_DN5363_c0_g1_i1.p1 TRINITY_DN5363_c0_g1~~TRINITY_DN5363_c0_g1_i1.p1  ORF type:complete len:181 (+),score=42.02 TRINITY_DN5363_c0_g1_i1:142-684(+)